MRIQMCAGPQGGAGRHRRLERFAADTHRQNTAGPAASPAVQSGRRVAVIGLRSRRPDLRGGSVPPGIRGDGI